MVVPLIIGGGLAAAGTIGSLMQKNKNYMKPYLDRALAELSGVPTPTADQLSFQLEQLVQAGQITPEQAQAYLQESTAYSDIPESSVGRDAELAALEELRGIVDAEGLTATDKARIGQIQSEIGTSQRGAREAILQNAAQRGISGSGLELAAQLSSQQAGATEANRAGLETAAMAEQRALEAIRSMGGLGGQVAGRDLQREQSIAEAKDAMARFNAANRQNVEFTNVGARNKAQEQNLAERQRVMDTNVGLRNQTAAQRAAAIQQEFANKMDVAGAKAGVLGSMGTAAQRKGEMDYQRSRDLYGGMMGAGGMILSQAPSYKTGKASISDDDEWRRRYYADAGARA